MDDKRKDATDGDGDSRLRLPCGRIVSYRDGGDANGHPLLALHGTPGSRLKFAGAAEAAARRFGFRLIAVDRWGYGNSDVPAAPSLAAFADDAAAIADALRLDRLAVIGISGGGPYAAAVAAGLGARVSAAALVAPVGPVTDLPRGTALGLHHHVAFRILPFTPTLLAAGFAAFGAVARRRPSLAARIAAGRALAPDRDMLRDRVFADDLGRTFAAGLVRTSRGPAVDVALFGRPWQLTFGRITAPVGVWIGDADRNVPLAAVARLIADLEQAGVAVSTTRLAAAGHFWIARHFDDVLGWMARARYR